MTSTEDLLTERYGDTRPKNTRRNRALSILGVGAMVLITGFFAMANYSPVVATDVGFRVESQWRTEVDFELSVPAGSTVVCTFEALDNSFGVVGFAEFEFGPSETDTNRYTVAINTYALAVTGLVDECTLR
ncbi:MAG: DUF4307 domain-containing protein [Aquiluna sp.]|nr:DUF4307 domain-containing protein [Aquiluna sp.]